MSNNRTTALPGRTQHGSLAQQRSALQIVNNRPNRIPFRRHEDPHVLRSYGDSITNAKQPRTIRIYFQNIKGLSYTTTREDSKYVFNHLANLQVDIAGLAETNSAWQHQFLRNELIFASRSIGAGNVTRTSFASPSKTIDLVPCDEIFQAGGSITTTLGTWVTTVFGPDIQDPTGLGRWSGMHYRGKHHNVLSVITGYRTCAGNKSNLGSTFNRE